MYPDEAELLQEGLDEDWLDEHYLRHDPFVLPDRFGELCRIARSELDVDPNGVLCVGSGAVGLSLNPEKLDQGRLKKFDSRSDIDLAIISRHHFEVAWRDLREASRPQLAAEIDRSFRQDLKWQRKRHFDGVIVTTKLLPYLSFGRQWQNGFAKMGQWVAETLDREVELNVWLYADYWSVRNYISKSISMCQTGTTNA